MACADWQIVRSIQALNDLNKKSLLKSKTFWVAVGVSVISVLDGPMKDIIKEQPPLAGLVVSILMIVLRFLTTNGVKLK